jgi:hypothetical protein
MFRWAIREELFAGPSPMAQVKQPEKTAARTRVLEDDEIRGDGLLWHRTELLEAKNLAVGSLMGCSVTIGTETFKAGW